MQKQWKIGVRPAFPAQNVNSGAGAAAGESWQAPAAQSGVRPQRCRANWCSAVSRR
jgi:hypothetical protein